MTEYGEIVYVNPTGGFGFIKAAGHPDGLFFHCADVLPRPAIFDLSFKGRQVSFTAASGPKGMKARNVQLR